MCVYIHIYIYIYLHVLLLQSPDAMPPSLRTPACWASQAPRVSFAVKHFTKSALQHMDWSSAMLLADNLLSRRSCVDMVYTCRVRYPKSLQTTTKSLKRQILLISEYSLIDCRIECFPAVPEVHRTQLFA